MADEYKDSSGHPPAPSHKPGDDGNDEGYEESGDEEREDGLEKGNSDQRKEAVIWERETSLIEALALILMPIEQKICREVTLCLRLMTRVRLLEMVR